MSSMALVSTVQPSWGSTDVMGLREQRGMVVGVGDWSVRVGRKLTRQPPNGLGMAAHLKFPGQGASSPPHRLTC